MSKKISKRYSAMDRGPRELIKMGSSPSALLNAKIPKDGVRMTTIKEDSPLLQGGGDSSNDLLDAKQQSLRETFRETVRAQIRERRHHRFYSILEQLTLSDRHQALKKEGVGPAAFLIRDAIMGDEVENPADGIYDPYAASNANSKFRNTVSVICHRVCAYRPFVRFIHATCWVLVILTFIEPPDWCRSRSESDASNQGCLDFLEARGVPADKSTKKKVEYYPNSHSMLLTKLQSAWIGWTCLGIFFAYVLLRVGRDGMSVTRFLRPGKARLSRVIQLVCLFLLAMGLSTGWRVHQPFARLLLLMSLNPFNMQRDLNVRILPSVFNVLALLFAFILFYGWFGTVMFLGSKEGKLMFPSLVEAVWTLWICVTTANYPDVMMPAYNKNRWVAVYFVSFMVLSYFFFMNLILAVVVNEYENAMNQRKQQRGVLSQNCLRKAYKLLDPHGTGRIDRETVMALFCILNEDFPEFRQLSPDDEVLLFAFLDKDGSSTITENEFLDFSNVLLLEFDRESDYTTWVERNFPKVFHSDRYQRFCTIVKSKYFEIAIDLILLLNAAVIAVQTYPELSAQKVKVDPKYFDGSIDTRWEIVETLFTAIYCLEAFVKITVYGWKAYREKMRNVFDFVITMLAVVCTAIVYYPNKISDSRVIRMIVMARVLRLFRVLAAMKAFQLVFQVSGEVLSAAAGIVFILFCLMYIFAAIGLQLYGGMVTRDPEDPLAYLILNTDFSDNDYWANNFNDMISGMNVLFNLLVVNNWTECEVGFEAVTQAKWVRFFFLAFHLAGVVIVNNLVIALIINITLDQLAISLEPTEDEVVGREAVIRGRTAIFDAKEVTGTTTTLSGGYIARLRHAASDVDSRHEKERLRALFTQACSDVGDSEAPKP